MSYPNPHAAGCFWHSLAEQFGAPNIKWCEATLCTVVSEPANSWSNLAYLLVGLVMAWRLFKAPEPETVIRTADGGGKPNLQPASLRPLPLLMVVMGLFSFIYHASNLYLTQQLDFAGMFLFLFYLLGLNLQRLGWLTAGRQRLLVIALSLAGALLVHLMYRAGWPFQFLVVLIGLCLIGSEAAVKYGRPPGSLGLIGTALLFLLAAQSASLADLKRLWCSPGDHLLQGHALWHVLSAVGLYAFFEYYLRLVRFSRRY